MWNYSTCFWCWSLNLQTRASGRADRWAAGEARRNWKLSECTERTSAHCRLLLPPSSYCDDGGILPGKLAPFITELSTGLIQESGKLQGRRAAGAGGEPADHLTYVPTCRGLQQHLVPYADLLGIKNMAAASSPPAICPAKCLWWSNWLGSIQGKEFWEM